MMKNYEKSVRPVQNSTEAVVIKLGITLTQIFDLDERNQVLTVSVWLDQEWKDDSLNWEPAEYGNIQKVQVPCNLLWLPDIVLYNSVDDYTEEYMRSLAMIFPDGTVFWPPIVRFRSSCKVDITYFPFDDQICHMKMGSWAYDGFQVDVTNRSTKVDLSNYVNNGEWELIELRTVRNTHYYDCCPEPFPDITFWFHLRRRTTYYTFNIIIPCTILSLLTMASFLLPPASGEKISLGLTVLLAFSVFMLLIAETMPATSEFVPLIGMYLTVIMAMTSLSVVFSVFVLYVHHKGNRGVRAPSWLRKFSFQVMARILCMQSGSQSLRLGIQDDNEGETHDLQFNSDNHHTHNSPNIRYSSMHRNRPSNGNHPHHKNRRNHSDHSEQHNNHVEDRDIYSDMVNSSSRLHNPTENIYVKENGQILLPPYNISYVRGSAGMYNNKEQEQQSNLSGLKSKWFQSHDELLSHLKWIVTRQRQEDIEHRIVREWQDVGSLCDRLLLIVFTSITAISTIGLLVLKPMTKSMNIESHLAEKMA